MRLKTTLITIVLLIITVITEASIPSRNTNKSISFGVCYGIGSSFMDELGKKEDSFQGEESFLFALYLKKPLNPWLESQLELQYINRKFYRCIEHPQPYVFDKDVNVEISMLRFPLSLILSSSTDPNVLALYMGGGAAFGYPLRARMKSRLNYNTESISSTDDIQDSMALPQVSAHAMLGIKYDPYIVELRFERDLNSIDLPNLEINDVVPWGLWILFGIHGRR